MACKLGNKDLYYPSSERIGYAHDQIASSHTSSLIALAEIAADNDIQELAEAFLDEVFATLVDLRRHRILAIAAAIS